MTRWQPSVRGWNARRAIVTSALLSSALALFAGTAGAAPPALATGPKNGFAIDSRGKLFGWGSDDSGQLGLGRLLNSSTFLRVGSPFASVATSRDGSVDASMAISEDGSLWAWGANTYGVLGDRTQVSRDTPVLIGTGYRAVATQGYHTAAVKLDGSLWHWGSNPDDLSHIRLGDGFVSVTMGVNGYIHAIKADGTLWGYDHEGFFGGRPLPPVLIGTGYKAVAAGGFQVVALKTDGTLWTWQQSGTPTLVGSDFMAIAAGYWSRYALKSDGTLWAWGLNFDGQLGDGTTVDRATPTLIGGGYEQVAAGSSHAVAVKRDGTLWAWGANHLGPFGNGTLTGSNRPVLVGTGYRAVAAGFQTTLAVRNDGSLWASGSNRNGALGVASSPLSRYVPALIGDDYAAVSASGNHTAAIKTDGGLWIWGSNSLGEFGNTTLPFSSRPVSAGTGFRAVAAGLYYTVAIANDNGLWAWGADWRFQDDGGMGQSGSVGRTPLGAGFRSVIAATGGGVFAAIKNDGVLMAWRGISSTPRVLGSGYTAASMSEDGNHLTALQSDGSLWRWSGLRARAESAPVLLGRGFKALAEGNNTTWAIRTDGTLWRWSWLGVPEGVVAPQQQVGENYTAFAAASFFQLALKSDGLVLSMGANGNGELGAGVSIGRQTFLANAVNSSGDDFLDLLPEVANRSENKLLPFLMLTQRQNALISALLTDPRASGLSGEIYFTALVPQNSPLLTDCTGPGGCTGDGLAAAAAVNGRPATVRGRAASTSGESGARGGRQTVAAAAASSGMVSGVLSRGGFKQTGGAVPAESVYAGPLQGAGDLAVIRDALLEGSNVLICMGVTVPDLSAKGQALMRPIATGTAVPGVVQCPPVQTGATIARFRAQASGALNSRTIVAEIDPLPEERGQTRKVYSWAVTPSGRQYMQTGPNQWEDMAEPMRPVATITLPSSGPYRLEVARNLGLDQLAGTLVFIGIGESWEQVRDFNRAGHYYTVQ